jgi:hypothetical protein
MDPEFKIIAIKPCEDCNEDFLKVLKGGTLYRLCNDYTFEKKFIKYQSSYPASLFKVNDISVNISAVVGKNGSGKSSLFELLFAGLYHLSVTEKILKIPPGKKNEIWYEPTGIKFDLFYQVGNYIFEVGFRDSTITYRKYGKDEMSGNFHLQSDPPVAFRDTQFFYSIIINYSFYALNTLELGPWLKLLFHKNDSYQTPVVINPLRTEGNIDVNREKDLVHTRMLYALLQPISGKPEDSLLHLAPGKIAENIALLVDSEKLKRKGHVPKHQSTKSDFLFRYRLPDVFERFLNDRKFKPKDNLHNFYGQLYIMRKLINIAETYDTYKYYLPALKKNSWTGNKKEREELFRSYLNELLKDHSHVTFKLRRAINSLVYEFYDKNDEDAEIKITELSRLTFEYSGKTGIPIIELLPPPHLFTDVYFEKGKFSQLSSGEKQKVYSTYSIIYHLINLDSVKKGLKKYRHVSCVLDEIELYYHPEMQRTYVDDLLSTLEKTNLDFIKSINFCFITHSPFILSDIPKSNVLYLKLDKDGKALPEVIDQDTFGANIYDLLSHSFYFQDGFIGAKAKMIIQQVIDNLQDRPPKGIKLLEEATIEKIIEIIGEPFLRDKLIVMFEKKFKNTNLRQREVQVLRERLAKLDKAK